LLLKEKIMSNASFSEDQVIIEMAELNGAWLDDFDRWNFQGDDKLLDFAEAIKRRERDVCAKAWVPSKHLDKEDEARIKAYMAAKMKHIKMYNECMNLADGLDVEKFAELVRDDEREACAKVLEAISNAPDMQSYAAAIRARGEK